jgi:hypothetical protein
MPEFENTDYEGAAKATVHLVDHGNTPDDLSEAVIDKLVRMADAYEINIWHREAGLNVVSLAALYRLYETGAGYRRSRIYAEYAATVSQRAAQQRFSPLMAMKRLWAFIRAIIAARFDR